MARKGLTDEVLWAVNPKLVIVHVSGFGQTGDPKMVKRAAYDLTVMAYAGSSCRTVPRSSRCCRGPMPATTSTRS